MKDTNNKIKLLRAESIGRTDEYSHFFTTRISGNSKDVFSSLNLGFSSGDSIENVHRNWEHFKAETGMEKDRIILPKQVHSDKILTIETCEHFNEILSEKNSREADAVILGCRGTSAAVVTADCVPVILASREKPAGAVIHSGWKGTMLNIAGKTVKAMIKKYCLSPSEFVAVIGPSIGACCYEVGKEVFTKFKGLFGINEAVIKHSNGRYFISLTDAVSIQLENEGIPSGNIEIMYMCTSCNEELFFSYRRDNGVTGRQASVLKVI